MLGSMLERGPGAVGIAYTARLQGQANAPVLSPAIIRGRKPKRRPIIVKEGLCEFERYLFEPTPAYIQATVLGDHIHGVL